MKLSLLIPCYNEEGNILPLYNAVKDAFDDKIWDYELIYINDGSFDSTASVLKKLVKDADVPVKAINFSRNFGKESAIFAGLHEASGDYITIMDGDLQQRPEVVLEMVNILDENKEYDCVTAFQEERNESKALIFFKDKFYKIINYISDTNFVNGASDFRTFRKNMADALLEMTEYHRFSKGLFSWVGFNTCYIPYKAEARYTGSTKWSFLKLTKYAVEGILAFTTTPLRISSVIGLVTTAAGLMYSLCLAVSGLLGRKSENYQKLAALITVLSGMQLTSTGIAGEYIARTYTQVKNRPVYVIRDILTNQKD